MKAYTENTVYFSALYGGMLYQRAGSIRDPLCGTAWPPVHSDTGVSCPRLLPLNTPRTAQGQKNDMLFLRRLPVWNEEHFRTIQWKIFHPPHTDAVLWPADLLILSESQRGGCHSSVFHVYGDFPLCPPSRQTERFALAFRLSERFPLRGLSEILGQQGQSPPSQWKTPSAREIAAWLLHALEALNQSGYYYNDFHFSRLFLTEDGQFLLDYSDLIGSRSVPLKDAAAFNPLSYPPECADPAVMRRVVPYPDEFSQNVSLCALLFYLFFDRFPYDGDALKHLRDDTPRTHYRKFRNDYHEIFPVFIFDPHDRRNSLGLFQEDTPAVERWNQTPEPLKQMFITALSAQTVLRETADGTRAVPGPGEWAAGLRAAGWI